MIKLSQVLFNSQPLRLFCDLNADQAVSGFIQWSAFESFLLLLSLSGMGLVGYIFLTLHGWVSGRVTCSRHPRGVIIFCYIYAIYFQAINIVRKVIYFLRSNIVEH